MPVNDNTCTQYYLIPISFKVKQHCNFSTCPTNKHYFNDIYSSCYCSLMLCTFNFSNTYREQLQVKKNIIYHRETSYQCPDYPHMENPILIFRLQGRMIHTDCFTPTSGKAAASCSLRKIILLPS